LIEEKRKDDIFLTICGFGMGNYKDGRMEQISNAGNGNYFYIDNIRAAEKVFKTELLANMFTIAKDVKIQAEFNPANVQAYRLLGYENRSLNDEDFNNDRKDAGELGAGHTVTALYEVIPAGVQSDFYSIDPLKYQPANQSPEEEYGNELLTVKLRYKEPDKNKSVLISETVRTSAVSIDETSDDFRWSATVAAFGMWLRKSEYLNGYTLEEISEMAVIARGSDPEGYRSELIRLIKSQANL
jgi:Ca-activated chloride channel family protein